MTLFRAASLNKSTYAKVTRRFNASQCIEMENEIKRSKEIRDRNKEKAAKVVSPLLSEMEREPFS